MPPPLQFATVLRDELKALRPDLTPPPNPTVDQLYTTIDDLNEPMAALCLSGGGIRSASFALGILQGLTRFGVLGQFHYLSTVSGGGYIGSWLTAWRHHARSDEEVFSRLDRTANQTGKEADEVNHLRANSNYLTPKLGLLSADTWTVVALTIRNLVLNWLVFLPLFMGVLFFPWLCDDVLKAAEDRPGLATPLMWLGIVAVTIGLAFASYGRRRASGVWLTDGRFVLTALGPVIVASIGFTVGLAALHGPSPSLLKGAIVGGVCYVLAWLLASVFRSRDPAPTLSRAVLESEGRVKDLAAWAVAGAIAGCLLASGMQVGAALGDRFKTEWLTVLRHRMDDAVDLRRRACLCRVAQLRPAWRYGSGMAGPSGRMADRGCRELGPDRRRGVVQRSRKRRDPPLCRGIGVLHWLGSRCPVRCDRTVLWQQREDGGNRDAGERGPLVIEPDNQPRRHHLRIVPGRLRFLPRRAVERRCHERLSQSAAVAGGRWRRCAVAWIWVSVFPGSSTSTYSRCTRSTATVWYAPSSALPGRQPSQRESQIRSPVLIRPTICRWQSCRPTDCCM